jgi:very-short-patch-repair endonuclease
METAAMQWLVQQCESPIEVKMAEAMLLILGWENAQIIPQYRVARYRFDFAICFIGCFAHIRPGRPVLLIECDGKDFHSSPEQLKNDAAKNRCALEIGAPCLRFTGSEIWKNAFAAATAVEEALYFIRKAALNSRMICKSVKLKANAASYIQDASQMET